MKRPTLTVVVPNFNHADYLENQLQLILEQTLNPIEIIVIDDGSTDNSVEIVKGFIGKNKLVRLICNEHNKGVNFSVNRAIEAASGEYVCCCPADDKVLPGFFEKSITLLSQHPEAGLCCSQPAFLDDATGKLEKYVAWRKLGNQPRYIPVEELIKIVGPDGLWIAGITCVFKRNLFLESGKYIAKLRWHSDWFIWHVIAFRYGVCYIPETLAAIRTLPNSYSSVQQRGQAQLEILNHLLCLLKSPDYQDVLIPFRRSGILSEYGLQILEAAIKNWRHWSFLPILPWKKIFWLESKRVLAKIAPEKARQVYRKLKCDRDANYNSQRISG